MNGLLAVFLLVYGLLHSFRDSEFTTACCVAFAAPPKSLNYFWVKFKISKRQAKSRLGKASFPFRGGWRVAGGSRVLCGLIKFQVHFSLNFKIICTC